MTRNDIVQAWKNPAYRRNLSQEQLANMPSNPAGAIELSASDLSSVSGGASHTSCCTCAPLPNSLCTPCPPAYCF